MIPTGFLGPAARYFSSPSGGGVGVGVAFEASLPKRGRVEAGYLSAPVESPNADAGSR